MTECNVHEMMDEKELQKGRQENENLLSKGKISVQKILQ